LAPSFVRLTVINVTFIDPEPFLNLTEVYAILAYSTPMQKMLTNPAPCLFGTCTWNKTFKHIPLSP
jgi:hypothetical protein